MLIHHIGLTVKDLKISRAFYEQVFGLQFVKEGKRPQQGLTFIWLTDNNGTNLELIQPSKPVEMKSDLAALNEIGIKHVAFSVTDVDAVFSKSLEAGAIEVWLPQEGVTIKRLAFIKDPDGIVIEIAET